MLEDVIISCFLTDSSIVDYLDKLNINDFATDDNQKIIAIMKDLKAQNVRIDYVTVANKMPFSELSIKTLPNLTSEDGMYKSEFIDDYIKELKMESAKRNIKTALMETNTDLIYGKDVKELIKDTTEKLNNIDLLDEEKLIDVGCINPSNYINRVRIKSEFSNLDKMIGGFSLGELSIWTGKSGQRKVYFSFSAYA